MLIQITEYLGIDIATERWMCHRCGYDLASAHECYKLGCLCRARDPREIHFPLGPSAEFNFSCDPNWMQIIEYYCPQCATLIETEYLPPGHPLTWDIQIDIAALRRRHGLAADRNAGTPA
jgi:acetophenone carboxylase